MIEARPSDPNLALELDATVAAVPDYVYTLDVNEHLVDLFYQPMRDTEGTVIGVLVQGVDVTDQAMARKAIAETNADLENQVAQRTKDLANRNMELEGFTYSVSHDMRTPLRAMVSNARMVLDEESEHLSADGKLRLERLSLAAVRMAQLVDDLLKYARLGNIELVRESVPIAELARHVLEQVTSGIQNCDVHIEVDPSISVSADSQLLAIILQNLFENACKYRSRDHSLLIHFGRETQGSEVVFFVADNGIGFDMAYLDKLFVPFERLHREDIPGTGIGLANVKRAVERHGGRVWAEGEEGQGATFYFTLGSDSNHSAAMPA